MSDNKETEGNGSTVMIVDDDPDARTMMRTILTGNGYEVIECESGVVALERLSGDLPDVMLLDIMMPEMSGYDVLVQMRQQPRTQNIPVIMVTAKGDATDVLTGYKDYAVDYYITKPFTTRQLLAGIQLIIDT